MVLPSGGALPNIRTNLRSIRSFIAFGPVGPLAEPSPPSTIGGAGGVNARGSSGGGGEPEGGARADSLHARVLEDRVPLLQPPPLLRLPPQTCGLMTKRGEAGDS
eukprot:CAMPEP_0172808944 /NCGR_PEP_ID=MMETSP1075-20121228/7972_1 /TAXON_ID=2916 /ORGANISM="Ceratium fusus, Strain PA161109" /LENGTH=104 /DNA_ID=CAMNT_0013648137 /DNA_START=50 /DNA_END=364 /DNA_ORIENTATION=+